MISNPSAKFTVSTPQTIGPGWVKENTAILVVHGIGNQVPLATLDDFARGLVKEYRKVFGGKIKLSHELMAKDDDGKPWFDNVLRIRNGDHGPYIDIYEYYWANYTEDKASWDDLNKWLQGVVNGAKQFYKTNAKLGEEYKDKSPFFDSKTGKFNERRYRLFISTVSRIFMAINLTLAGIIKVISFIPFLGGFASSMMQKLSNSYINNLTNIIGDIAIYNVVDPKSKFYFVRKQIAAGAIGALRFLVEKTTDTKKFRDLEDDLKQKRIDADTYSQQLKTLDMYYPSVLVAGHSLGSQVSYDAINKLNLLINEGEIKTYTPRAISKLKRGNNISRQLRGFITFGCPLDKIIFFLRENVPDEQYIRQQMVNNYHGFKQRSVNHYNNAVTNKEYIRADCGLVRFMEDVVWRNYYDTSDYVSGGLDYYTGLTNINCDFKAGKFDFTHSWYWTSNEFYKDIIHHYLNGYSESH